MRVNFLAPHVRIAGGVRAILTYADRLAGRGHEVSVIVPAGGAVKAWWGNRADHRLDWMPDFRGRLRWVSRWDPAALPEADALVATAWQSAAAVADAPARAGRKHYLVQHYESLYHGEPARVDATYRLPLRKICISTWLSEIMRDKFASASDVIVTPVDPGLFHEGPREADDGRLRVLMLHHEYAWKGVAEGLEAVARVRARHPRLALVGFGVKPPRVALPYEEFHANLPQARLAWLYSRCPIYLCPSWDEGLGMPPMEAMACGAALATYDNGGCRDYARDGETALVAPRRDVGALTRALERLVEDAALRERLARAGQAFIRREFDWDRATARLEAILGDDARVARASRTLPLDSLGEVESMARRPSSAASPSSGTPVPDGTSSGEPESKILRRLGIARCARFPESRNPRCRVASARGGLAMPFHASAVLATPHRPPSWTASATRSRSSPRTSRPPPRGSSP